ncbi:MAG TPA: RNA polymerase sigma factor [Hellea balneolensis]|uniref:RNA polymerase sigma factor n=1 Tax=Hellea balneolensis TaxID=287478 RepID=A0A7C5LUE8_9PROT|nr:RNA polymerase sigma factor [Hellea balneolensis]
MSEEQRKKLVALYLEQRAALLRFLCARLRNPELAEDVLQDLYLKISGANLSTDIGNPSGFLFRMASNLALDHIRKTKRTQIRDQAWSDLNSERAGNDFKTDTPEADAALIAKERLAALKNRLQSLSPKAREAFERHKFQEQSYQQIADEMGISIGTVGKHMGKALKHIMNDRGDV